MGGQFLNELIILKYILTLVDFQSIICDNLSHCIPFSCTKHPNCLKKKKQVSENYSRLLIGPTSLGFCHLEMLSKIYIFLFLIFRISCSLSLY